MLTRDEWTRHAEIAAAHKFGENHYRWFTFRRWLAGPIGVLVGAGVLGWACWWIWTHAIVKLFSGEPIGRGVPWFYWVLLLVVAVATPFAVRRKLIPDHPAVRTVKIVVTILVWLGMLSYLVALA